MSARECFAPPGFGREYARVVGRPADAVTLATLLAVVGYEVSAETIEGWPFTRRVEAEVYATNVHLRASDHWCRPHPKPAWMPVPWQGPSEGLFAGPGGTPL